MIPGPNSVFALTDLDRRPENIRRGRIPFRIQASSLAQQPNFDMPVRMLRVIFSGVALVINLSSAKRPKLISVRHSRSSK